MAIAAGLSCKSIAFPLIATGVYGFPKDEALQIALDAINRFLLRHDMKIILVVFDRKAFELSGKLVGDIEEYIDEHAIRAIREEEYCGDYGSERRRRNERIEADRELLLSSTLYDEEKADAVKYKSAPLAASKADFPNISGKSLDEVLGNAGETFQQRLFKLIDGI